MIRLVLAAAAAVLIGGPAVAQGAPIATPLGSFTTTNSGQPILPPAGPVQVTAQTVELPAGSVLPAHRHPHTRYGYVLAGRIKVDNLDTGQTVTYGPGEMIIEAIGQWHMGTPLDGAPVKLLVVDQTPPGEGNMVRKEP